MTPQERQMMAELFNRLATLENSPRDPDAEAMIREGFRRAPNAAYALVQTVLLQDEALKAANAHIQEYEQQRGAPQQQEQPRGFLDNMRDSFRPRRAARLGAARAAGRSASRWARRRRGRRAVRAATSKAAISRVVPAGRADAGAAAAGWRRLVPRHRGGRRGRHDRRLAADGRHPLGDGRARRLEPGRGRVRLARRAAAGSVALERQRRAAAISRATPASMTSAAARAAVRAKAAAPACSTAPTPAKATSDESYDDGDAGDDDGGDSEE